MRPDFGQAPFFRGTRALVLTTHNFASLQELVTMHKHIEGECRADVDDQRCLLWCLRSTAVAWMHGRFFHSRLLSSDSSRTLT